MTSPIINGGIKKLSFSYGYVLTDPGVSFQIKIYGNASANPVVLKTITINNPDAVKLTPYNYVEELNIDADDLMIEIKPLSLQQATTNKDRFAIWNIVWENM